MLKNRKIYVGNIGFIAFIKITIYKKILKNRKVCVGNLGFLTLTRKIYVENLDFLTRKVCVGNLGFLTLTMLKKK